MKPASSKKQKTATSSKAPRDSEDDDDSDASSDGKPAHARSSKHAPTVQSSKRAVTRRRTAVEVKKPVVRDPRFDPLAGPRPDENVLKKRYAFLEEYKASEMAELKETIKKTKNESEKEVLKRKLLSMESQRKAQEAKDKKQEILREHKKKEKELVKEGKQPFFLKKCKLLTFPDVGFLIVVLCLHDPHFCNSCHVLTCFFSRAKEASPHRQVQKHEAQTARARHRAPSQEGHGKRAQGDSHGAYSILMCSVFTVAVSLSHWIHSTWSEKWLELVHYLACLDRLPMDCLKLHLVSC